MTARLTKVRAGAEGGVMDDSQMCEVLEPVLASACSLQREQMYVA